MIEVGVRKSMFSSEKKMFSSFVHPNKKGLLYSWKTIETSFPCNMGCISLISLNHCRGTKINGVSPIRDYRVGCQRGRECGREKGNSPIYPSTDPGVLNHDRSTGGRAYRPSYHSAVRGYFCTGIRVIDIWHCREATRSPLLSLRTPDSPSLLIWT